MTVGCCPHYRGSAVKNYSARTTTVRGRRSTTSASLSLLFIAFALASFPARAEVGRTPGSFAVSPTGAASYTIPIWVPPGPRGLQPHLALVYNSQAGSGPLGFGWGLAGLSAITRCNQTVAQDAAPAPIALTLSDVFCLDGQRLRVTSGTYGAVNSTYQTEVANMSLVTAGTTTAGNGPASFTVRTRDGLTYTYGATMDSQVIAPGTPTALSWLVNEVQDRAGNTMLIAYVQSNGSAVPDKISWTPSAHGSSTYNYSVKFLYGPNRVPSSVYKNVAGTAIRNTSLLSSVSVFSGTTLVKEYFLTYEASPVTGRDRMNQVEECADAGATNCFSPTLITYQGTSGSQIGVTSSASTAVSVANAQVVATRDFNGDGRDDILYLANGALYVAFATASGFSAPKQVTSTSAPAAEIAVGDILGKGQTDILLPVSGTLWRYTWNASTSAFVGAPLTGITIFSGEYVALADVNGDGLPDLITTSGYNTEDLVINVRLNTSSGGVVSFGTGTNLPDVICSGNYTVCQITVEATGGLRSSVRQLDFNGDGRADFAIHAYQGYAGRNYWWHALYVSTSTASSVSFAWYYSVLGDRPPFIYLNANDDRCTDIAVNATLWLAPCNGAAGSTQALGGVAVGAVDWDGDGRDDVLVANGSTVGVLYSTGTAMSALNATSVPYSANFFVFDANGDGLQDLGAWSTSSITYFLHNGSSTPPDLATLIKDGFGGSASLTYVPITQGAYTPCSTSCASYPEAPYIGPLYVTSQGTFADGSAIGTGTYLQTYSYTDARVNLQGRGFDGFYPKQTYDSRTGLNSLQYYGQAFPYLGIEVQDTVQNAANGKNVAQSAGVYVKETLDGTTNNQRYLPYPQTITKSQWEYGGSEDTQLITTSVTSNNNVPPDQYGNFTNISTVTTDNDNNNNNPYYTNSWTTAVVSQFEPPDTANWCVSLPKQVQVTKSALPVSVGATVTETVNFTPDSNPAMCRVKTQVTQPAGATTYQVTETLGFDVYGNVNSDTVTGNNMTARPTTIDWGTASGQFPLTVTDPSGAITQYSYVDSSGTAIPWGSPGKVTDPNNLKTLWQYDAFGRKIQETRPDLTYSKWTFTDCASSACLVGAHGLIVAQTVYNTDTSVQTDATEYFDSLDRPLVTQTRMLAIGNYARNEVSYDPLGRVVKQAAPCTWSALTTSCTYWTTIGYDNISRVTSTQRPISATNNNPQTTNIAYAGRTTTVTDPQSKVTSLVTDVNGWQRRTTDATGYYVVLGYDAAGNKTSVTDSASNTLWSGAYAPGTSFLTGMTDMDRGGGWIFTPDALGEMTAWTDAKGQHFSATYDALSRPFTRTEPDLYTSWTWGSTPGAYNVGKLASVCTGTGSNQINCTVNPGYSESETYDVNGRLSNRAITLPSGGPYTYTWAYSATTGLLNTLTYPVSTGSYRLELQYAYQNAILQSITNVSDTPNVTVWTANAMNPAGQVTQESLGNGIVTNRAYDAVTHWLGSVQSGVGGGAAAQNQSFLFDEMGNVTQRQDNNLGLTESIFYDSDYRLSYSKLNGIQNLSLTYDVMGNISARSDVAGGAGPWIYDSVKKHAVTQAGSSAFNYSYDSNGNAITRQGNSIGWTSYNYPTVVNAGSGSTAELVSFLYGPDRQRWQQAYSGNGINETTNYIGGLLEQVVSGGVTDYRHYIYAGSEPVTVYHRNSVGSTGTNYFLSDHEGSIASLNRASGTSIVQESYTPFGLRRNPATWSGAASNADLTTSVGVTRQGYTFQTALGLWMGMNHMNGRVQDAVTGRFLSADPYVPDPTNTQTYNRYSYVNNNPLSLMDPSGFKDCAERKSDCGDDELTVDVNGTRGGPPGPQSPPAPPLSPGSLGGAGPSAPRENKPKEQSKVCAQAAAAMQAFNNANGQQSSDSSSGVDALANALAVGDAAAQAAQANPGAVGAAARTAAPFIGPVGNAVDATAAIQSLQAGDINSAAARGADVYIGFNLLKIPEYGPLLAAGYYLVGGMKSMVNSVSNMLTTYELAGDALYLGNQCLSSGGTF